MKEIDMYLNVAAFETAVFACNPPYSDRELASVEVAWNIYRAAQNTDLNLLVLGRWVANSIVGGAGIDNALQNNMGRMNEVFTGGAIMNSGNWTMLVNDAWVLGGVHSHTSFYLASERTMDNIYNVGGPYHGQMTVTGRELTGLAVFGYTVRALPLGEVAVCTNPALADMADFATYRQHVDMFTNTNSWVDLVDHLA
jgi:hypothetical protein